MKLQKVLGATSEIWQIFISDSSSTTGAGLTGLTNASSGLTAYYHRDTDTTATAISLVTMTVGTFTSSGFKEIDATNMPGWYQFCPPNAAFASGAKSCAFHLKGATNMAPLPIEVQLTATNVDDATAFGLSRLDAAISSRMATFTLPTNFSSLSVDASGRVDVIKVNGTSQTARDLGAQLDATVSSRLAPTTAGRTLDVTATGEAGIDWANIGAPTTTVNLSGTTVSAVSGAVGSVTGAVGSVTGNVGGNVTGSIGSLAAQAKADVNAEVDSALDTAIPVSPTANSINERIQTMDNAYTATRATNLDNLDAAVSTRSTYAGGAVASVTGNVGGNVVGSIGSVAAGGITSSSFGASAIDAAALATDAGQEIADRFIARNIAGGSDTGRTVKMALARLVNRVRIAAGVLTTYDTDDSTALFTQNVTTTAGNPISEVDTV